MTNHCRTRPFLCPLLLPFARGQAWLWGPSFSRGWVAWHGMAGGILRDFSGTNLGRRVCRAVKVPVLLRCRGRPLAQSPNPGRTLQERREDDWKDDAMRDGLSRCRSLMFGAGGAGGVGGGAGCGYCRPWKGVCHGKASKALAGKGFN